VSANKAFSADFVQAYGDDKSQSSPFAQYLSFCSYLYQHAYRSQRATQYAHLTLFTIQNLVEDLDIVRKLCETTVPLRLSRQRPPQLPLVTTDRTLAANIIDVMIDSINHNLRKKLDVELYMLNVGILLRLITFLSKARIRLSTLNPISTHNIEQLANSLINSIPLARTLAVPLILRPLPHRLRRRPTPSPPHRHTNRHPDKPPLPLPNLRRNLPPRQRLLRRHILQTRRIWSFTPLLPRRLRFTKRRHGSCNEYPRTCV
jgi:hypothetical protein